MTNQLRSPLRSSLRSPFEHRRGGSVAAWSPLALFSSGEQGFIYDPSDRSTLFQDSAGTTPVTGPNQPVGLMLDKSGRGNHAVQPTSGKRPMLKTDGVNWYLQGDGIDDFMYTGNIDFTGTDKMTVWAGVRKLDDNPCMVAELSGNNNQGSFYVLTGTDFGVTGYHTLARGSAPAGILQDAVSSTFYGVDTAALTITHNIPGDLSTIQRNGVAGTPGTGDKGDGNFGNYSLYLLSRGSTSLFFNGYLYSLIIRGAATDAAGITDGEKWTAKRIGVTLP